MWCQIHENLVPRLLPDCWQNVSGLQFLSEAELADIGWLPVLPDGSPTPEGQEYDRSTYVIDGTVVRETKIFRAIVPQPNWEAFRSTLLLSPEWERIESVAPGKASRLMTLLWRFNESPDIPALVGATWLQLAQSATITVEEMATFRQTAIDCHMPPAIVQLLGG